MAPFLDALGILDLAPLCRGVFAPTAVEAMQHKLNLLHGMPRKCCTKLHLYLQACRSLIWELVLCSTACCHSHLLRYLPPCMHPLSILLGFPCDVGYSEGIASFF